MTEEVEGEEGVESNSRQWSRRRVVVVVVIALMVCWIGWTGYGAHQRESARRLLEDRGYRLITEEYGFGWYRGLAKTYPLPKLERVTDFANIKISRTPAGPMVAKSYVMSREEWEALGHLRTLTSISVTVSIIEDPDLYRFTRWPHLQFLRMYRVPVTDECLLGISSLVDLRRVSLSHTNITDEGLKHLGGMPIEFLVIRSNNLTDACLPHLATLTDLEELILIGTKVTPEKAKKILPWIKRLAIDDDIGEGEFIEVFISEVIRIKDPSPPDTRQTSTGTPR